ncbi:LOW QUALITY PROTEIN: hypothetical protein ACHAW5_004719 [Stephanodiscus triporus]|uniref:Peptidase A1 domain-containing protein n=1 Tax=Stephanodiscus triporus TaxID=2934178 RepID=A0ABD3MFP7_9STRA
MADVKCEIVRPSSYDGRHDEVSASHRGLLQATAAAILCRLPSLTLRIYYSPDILWFRGGGQTSFAADDASPTDVDRISVPLEYIPSLNAYVVHYYLFGVRFGAIVDSRNPFLTVPSTCSKMSYKYKWGCYHPEKTFGGFASNEESQPKILSLGVFGPGMLDGPGGCFWASYETRTNGSDHLSSIGYNNFCVDLRQTPQLVLSKESMIRCDDDYIPLSFIVNDLPLKLDKTNPTYVIFDTGLLGMAVSDELFEGRNLQARKNREKSVCGEVRVAFKTGVVTRSSSVPRNQ